MNRLNKPEIINFFKQAIVVLSVILLIYSCNSRKVEYAKNKNDTTEINIGLLGNVKKSIELSTRFPNSFVDPIDDTNGYQYFKDDLYISKDKKIFKKTVCMSREYLEKDSTLFIEYLKDMSHLINIFDYTGFKNGTFESRGKLYKWEGNSDGEYAVEIGGK